MQGDAFQRDAAAKALAHRLTPAVLHFDPLNRSFLSFEDAGGGVGLLPTRTRFDIQNNPLEIRDPDDVIVCTNLYSRLKHVIVRSHVASGVRRVLVNASGDPVTRWDDRNQMHEYVYDAGRRLTQTWLIDAAGRRLVERTIYGEGHAEAEARNLRGCVDQRYDTAGNDALSSLRF